MVKVFQKIGKLRQEIQVGNHFLVADEPVAVGGNDEGPSPFDFLAASLGACTGITLRLYANHKKWPLENAEITVNVENKKEGTKLTRQIHLIGPLSEEQKTRLMEIADKCPVHKALSGPITIETSAI